MAATLDLTCVRSVISRKRASDGADKEGIGKDPHLTVGFGGTNIYRSFIRFNTAVLTPDTPVAKVIKAEIVLRTEEGSAHFTAGSAPKIAVRMATSNFTEGNNGEGDWAADEYRWPGRYSTAESNTTHPKQDNLTVYLDVSRHIRDILPAYILDPNGLPGLAKTNYGYILLASSESDSKQRAVYFSRHHGTASVRPVLRLTYDLKNRKPNAPTLVGPPLETSPDVTFEGTHTDPDGDPIAAKAIEVYQGATKVWSLDPSLQAATPAEAASGQFSVPLGLALASLTSQTDYTWRAQTRDPAGLWSDWSSSRALRLTSASPPSVTASPLGSVAVLTGQKFGGPYSDLDEDILDSYQIQLRASALPSDPIWDAEQPLWDTGETLPTLWEIENERVAREYGGQSLTAATYSYRVRVKDASGLWSPWSYSTVTLTQDYIVDPGDIDLITQADRDAPVRIALYHIDPANRGPGGIIGWLEDPINLGASTFLNGAGELYFTLPALHPYCPEIEPHRTHYVVEQWWGDRFRPLFSGLITDFDATPDEVVFYGVDYLGLYQSRVDERFNPDKKDEAAPVGSKYTDKNLNAIILDQLTYHRDIANSPVKFITIGTISAMAERATIFSTYSEALPFMAGIIDSHKQGTGREARLYVRPKPAGGYEIVLTDNWGTDRRNIRLEYGGLLNGFRVVALGDFGTRVLGIGQKRGEVTVYRATGTSGLDEAQWGRIAKTRFWPDITDKADLERRAKEAAMQLSKVGKRIALAVRADGLAPFDGYDIGDSIWIDIDRGVVDTDEYGSEGLWTIYGLEFRYYPDGHHEITLTVLPKKSLTSPDPDLIPSQPPNWEPHWQVGYGVPTVYGEPPSPTPEP